MGLISVPIERKNTQKGGVHLKKKWRRFLEGSRSVQLVLLVGLLGIYLFFVTLNHVHTETYHIERFSMAAETIRSPITIENKKETERKTRETVQAVSDRYKISEEITEEQVNYVNEVFEAISTLEEELKVDRNEEEEDIPVPTTDQEKVEKLKFILSDNITSSVTDQTLIQLMNISKKDRDFGREIFISALEETLNNGVRTENIQTAITNIKDAIKYSTINEDLKVPLTKLSEFAVVENSFFDVEQTSEARKEAASNVEPVMIRAGEVIVREGQTITNEIYEKLDLVGVLDDNRNFFPLIGLGLLILAIVSVIYYQLRHVDKPFDNRIALAVISIFVIGIAFMKVISLYSDSDNQLFYVVPVATGALLMRLFINERFAIIHSILLSILGAIIFNEEIAGSLNAEAGIYFALSQLAGIFLLTNVKDRTAILKTGFGMTVVNIIIVLSFLFLSFEKYTVIDLLLPIGFAVLSALLSSVLTLGLLPFFETGLGILSDIKLLQLSNPNQPLLKKILTEAPGTYHHSVMVANLSEAACEAIGANGLLARVGAYYHDIGKTVRPHYFIENQLSIRNPHDFIDPKKSAKIIISHPYDGANLLEKYKMPEEIIDIAKQHHGTSLLKFFYLKEKETNPEVLESDFRYPGPKPQTKEAAIVCICDSVEAAVRALKEPTEEKIEVIVSSIINDRMTDNQLNESPLTMSDLNQIKRTVCETLKGIFHSRIQYPDDKEAD